MPGVLGYFQVDAAGRLTTPLLPEAGVAAASYGIAPDEEAARATARRGAARPARTQSARASAARGCTCARCSAPARESAPLERELGAPRGRPGRDARHRPRKPDSIGSRNRTRPSQGSPTPRPRGRCRRRSSQGAALPRAAANAPTPRRSSSSSEQTPSPMSGRSASKKRSSPSRPSCGRCGRAAEADASRPKSRSPCGRSQARSTRSSSACSTPGTSCYSATSGATASATCKGRSSSAGHSSPPHWRPLSREQRGLRTRLNVVAQGRSRTGSRELQRRSDSSPRACRGRLHRARLSPPFGDIELRSSRTHLPRAPGTALLAWVAVHAGGRAVRRLLLMYRFGAARCGSRANSRTSSRP